ncbi:MAG: hypothetical protein QM754_03660 [Tepidisphaeraceae bacterium]
MDNALDWKPRPFTEEELRDIDPVIRVYMNDVDQTMVIESLRMTPHERVAGLQKMNHDLQVMRNAAIKADDGHHSI